MSTTTMHFGPEWMRPKQQSISRPQQPPSPPPANPPSGVSTYSALVSPAHPTHHPGTQDEVHPFRYSKEELLKIYKDGGGKAGLGLEVERWDGVVREHGSDPVALREMGETEKKLFAGPLNSDIRRRQSTDFLSPLSTSNLGPGGSRLNHNPSTVGSPLRERFGNVKRRDSNAESPHITLPKKQSLSSIQAPTMSPREIGLPSPRTRVGYTPGFDGVLNGGDSWVARRRASEASQRSGGNPTNFVGEGEVHERTEGIKEEREEENDGRKPLQDPSPGALGNHSPPGNELSGQSMKDGNSLVHGVGQLSLNTNISSPVDGPQKHPAIGAPPGLGDLSSIEWSYKDPTGTVQGPFRADLMQKWCDDGYFTPDLPMKRTHLDTIWSTLDQLRRRCESDKVFLTPLRPLPPGLVRNDSPLQYNTVDPPLNGPYQPAPIRSLRTSTLESYISTGSNHSVSPSSSFGGGRFGDSSPEPNAFGGTTVGNEFYNGDPSGSARGSGFQTTPEIPSAFPGRRGLHAESPIDGPLAMGPGGFGGYGIPNAFGSPQGAWGTPPDNFVPVGYEGISPAHDGRDFLGFQNYQNQNLGGNYVGLRSPQDPVLDPHQSTVNYPVRPDHGNHTVGGDQHSGFNPPFGANHGQLYSHVPQQFNTIPPQNQHPSLGSLYTQPGVFPSAQNNVSIQQSPWSDVAGANVQGGGQFDGPNPTANATVVEPTSALAQTSPWDQATQAQPSIPVPKGASPWVVASHGTIESAWTEPPEDTQAPDANHATPEAQLSSVEPTSASAVSETPEEDKPEPESVEAPPVPSPPVGPSRSGKARKQASQISKEGPSKAAVVPTTPPVPQPEAPSPPSAATKPVWQKEDETKKAISLREIQEAEAKKAEAKKAAERERAARATANSPDKEDIQPFTASWGLPTSQAGSRSTALPVKEVVSSPTPAAVVPVWTAAPKVGAKKSMKEILEEEEKRKKTTFQVTAAATVVAAGPRRLPGDSTVKSPPLPTVGGAWTTVGPNGKLNAPPPTAVPVKPAAPPALPGVSRTNGPTPARPAATVKPTPAPRVEDATPSHEFLNWLNDSLKGLHNSVSVEEIMNMLLTFPIEADAGVREIISETIYTNSTTMDGRRFAEEFVTRRKADAATHGKNGGASKGPAKPASIADVVKAAPKPTQPEWGFKVVNKKKKGGRS